MNSFGRDKLLKFMLMGIGVAMLISACGSGAVDTIVNDGGSSSAVNEVDRDSSDAEVGQLPSASDGQSTEDGAPALGFVLGSPDLRATDPTTVSFASGQIQLIEFFAFW